MGRFVWYNIDIFHGQQRKRKRNVFVNCVHGHRRLQTWYIVGGCHNDQHGVCGLQPVCWIEVPHIVYFDRHCCSTVPIQWWGVHDPRMHCIVHMHGCTNEGQGPIFTRGDRSIDVLKTTTFCRNGQGSMTDLKTDLHHAKRPVGQCILGTLAHGHVWVGDVCSCETNQRNIFHCRITVYLVARECSQHKGRSIVHGQYIHSQYNSS